MTGTPSTWHAAGAVQVQPLARGEEQEVLNFLATRPTHTVILSSFTREHGLESPLNRGSFFACRNQRGRLEGVALIGHWTLMEARSEAAVAAFARLAREDSGVRVISGEVEKVEQFWDYYTAGGDCPHLRYGYLLFEQRLPVAVCEPVGELRLATEADLDLLVGAHAEVVRDELGVDVMARDPAGFRRRCAHRIVQGREWVWVKGERLIFKADVAAETPEAVYLEGVYVHPAERGKNYGLRGVSQLSRNLLARARALCLLVNEQNLKAQALYRKAGYTFRSRYATIYLQQ